MLAKDWLLCDADDTLWENNIHFEQVIAEFIEYLDHPELPPREVRARLDEIEVRNIKIRGYGVKNFALNLQECYEALTGRPVGHDEAIRLRDMITTIAEAAVDPIPGVPETLRELAGRYRLGLVTKGDGDEQHGKLERSGLGHWFTYVVSLPEKDVECYRSVVKAIGADPSRTWMIGNSPKSDINPALAAGLGAVLVRNNNTWHLEVQDVPDCHERFRSVERFSELASMF